MLKYISKVAFILLFISVNCYAVPSDSPHTMATKTKKMSFTVTLTSKATDFPIYKAEVTFVTNPKNVKGKTNASGIIKKKFKGDSWVGLAITAYGFRGIVTKTFHLKKDKVITLKLDPIESMSPVPTPDKDPTEPAPTITPPNFTASPTNTPDKNKTATPTKTPGNNKTPTPSATKTPAFTPTATPTQSAPNAFFNSPVGGEQWIYGNTADVGWNVGSENNLTTLVKLLGDDGSTWNIYYGVYPYKGKFTWTIGKDTLGEMISLQPQGVYRVQAEFYTSSSSNPIKVELSNFFSIKNPNRPPIGCGSGNPMSWIRAALPDYSNVPYTPLFWKGSTDGTKLIGVSQNSHDGFFGISINGGKTWTIKEATRRWIWMAISPDGKHLVASNTPSYPQQPGPLQYQDDAYIYISDDSGTTWRQVTVPKSGSGSNAFYIYKRAYERISMSPDGKKLSVIVADYGEDRGDYLFTSNDGGITWTKRLGPTPTTPSTGTGVFLTLGSFFTSDDQSKMSLWIQNHNSAAGFSSGRYITTNNGASWTKDTSILSDNDHPTKQAYMFSGDGGTLISYGVSSITAESAAIYISKNNGQTWTQGQGSNLKEMSGYGTTFYRFSSIWSSYDGSKMVAAVESGPILVSIDGGKNWDNSLPLNLLTNYPQDRTTWRFVTSKSDGTVLAYSLLSYWTGYCQP
jgi:hypothetical protein